MGSKIRVATTVGCGRLVYLRSQDQIKNKKRVSVRLERQNNSHIMRGEM